jgi:hypothetical protein
MVLKNHGDGPAYEYDRASAIITAMYSMIHAVRGNNKKQRIIMIRCFQMRFLMFF